MLDDAALLRSYVDSGSEAAFAALVERHCGLVYQAALRQIGGNAAWAEDVTQSVFILLARKARSLVQHPNVAGWLFATAHFVSLRAAQAEFRRKRREQTAQALAEIDSASSSDWDRLRPILDAAILSLGAADREAILHHYFQGQKIRAVAESLRISEAAAYKRLERAVERLRAVLAQRGIHSSASALALLIADQVSAAAPAGLAQAAAAQALASAATIGPIATGLLSLMSTIKSTAGVAAIAALLCLSGVGLALHEVRITRRDQTALAAATHGYQVAQLELGRLKRAASETDQVRTDLSQRATAVNQPERDPAADGRKFLAAFPQARDALRQMLRTGYSSRFAGFYRQAGLSPQQIERIETAAADLWIKNIELRPGNINSSSNQIFLPDDQLREIIGDQAFQAFQDYNRSTAARDLARSIVIETGYTGTALSTGQIDQLAAIAIANSRDYQSGSAVNLAALDWDHLSAQMRTVIPEPLWPAAQSAILASQYAAQFNQARTRAKRAP